MIMMKEEIPIECSVELDENDENRRESDHGPKRVNCALSIPLSVHTTVYSSVPDELGNNYGKIISKMGVRLEKYSMYVQKFYSINMLFVYACSSQGGYLLFAYSTHT